MLDDGTLRNLVDEFSITGLTSNPTIFDHAIGTSNAYDEGIRDKARSGRSGEGLFIELALEDLRRATDLFRPTYDATDGIDGWASMRQYRGCKVDPRSGPPPQSLREDPWQEPLTRWRGCGNV